MTRGILSRWKALVLCIFVYVVLNEDLKSDLVVDGGLQMMGGPLHFCVHIVPSEDFALHFVMGGSLQIMGGCIFVLDATCRHQWKLGDNRRASTFSCMPFLVKPCLHIIVNGSLDTMGEPLRFYACGP